LSRKKLLWAATQMAARDNKLKNAAHFEFEDVDGQVVYKSLYLDTLGEDARQFGAGPLSWLTGSRVTGTAAGNVFCSMALRHCNSVDVKHGNSSMHNCTMQYGTLAAPQRARHFSTCSAHLCNACANWCRRSLSPVDRHHKLQGLQEQRPSSSCEGYIHGSLSTAGIDGACALPKAAAWLGTAAAGAAANAASSCSSSAAAAVGVCRPNLLGLVPDDPGMRPKVLIPASTNRPDLAHTTADIEGAQPYPKDVCHPPRGTNPLSPQYRLASGR
jgi:hypothetical protein